MADTAAVTVRVDTRAVRAVLNDVADALAATAEPPDLYRWLGENGLTESASPRDVLCAAAASLRAAASTDNLAVAP